MGGIACRALRGVDQDRFGEARIQAHFPRSGWRVWREFIFRLGWTTLIRISAGTTHWED